MSIDDIDLRDYADLLQGSSEFLRMWARPHAPATCFIDPNPIGADPFLFGMAMVDAIRHGAKAYAQAANITEEHALERILEGFDAERGNHTTGVVSLSDKEGMH
jgi:hypothetical protein